MAQSKAKQKGLQFQIRASDVKSRPPVPRHPPFAGIGRQRKVAFLGGASMLKYAPWWDEAWELWSHASCRHMCKRNPDLLFDLHPKELWSDPAKKNWDPKYAGWLKRNHIPIMMQECYPEVPASIRYPFETMITEFPRGYMTNHIAYMTALALIQGVTHIAIYGCDYQTGSEYGPQRGCAEYWLGVAEGRGVQVLLPPGSDLLNKPSLLYGYQSHPKGKRDPSYVFSIGPLHTAGKSTVGGQTLTLEGQPDCPKPRNIGVPLDSESADRVMAAADAAEAAER